MSSPSLCRALCATLILASPSLVSAKQASEILARFGEPVQIFGDMIRNDISYVDGLQVNVYAPTNRTLTIEQNEQPLSGAFATGATGTNFRLAQGYSYKMSTNDPANDMIAQIAIPYDPIRLQNRSIDEANTYIGRLAGDGLAWEIADRDRTVQTAQFKTAMSRMTSLNGEYSILARQTKDEGNVFMEFGNGDKFAAEFTGGPGRQEVEFVDGLRFAVQSDAPLRMNVNLQYPIAQEQVPEGMVSLNSYAWVVNTTVNAQIQPAPPAPPPPENQTQPGAPNAIQPAVQSSPFVFNSPARRQEPPAGPPPPAAVSPAPPVAPGAPAPGASAAPEMDVRAAQIMFPVNMQLLQQRLNPTTPGAQPGAPPATVNNPSQVGEAPSPDTEDTSNPNMGSMAAMLDLSTISFQIGRRDMGAQAPFASTGGMNMMSMQGGAAAGGAEGMRGLNIVNGNIVFDGMTQLDGEYVILLPREQGVAATKKATEALKQTSGAERLMIKSGCVAAGFAGVIAVLLI